MSQSVWPFDHAQQPKLAAKVHRAKDEVDALECFVICPSRPKESFDDLFALVSGICQSLSKRLSIKFSCNRAIDITSAGVIQPEIWQQIRSADLILADLTGLNGNVLYELGAAAVWHPKERVVVIRERPPEGIVDAKPEVWLSDIQPIRHIQYVRTHSGLSKLAQELEHVFDEIVQGAPFEELESSNVTLPLSLDLSTGNDPRALLGPGLAHRRAVIGECFEFGSLYGFRYSWLTVGNIKLRAVKVRARTSFRKMGKPQQDQPWLGVMLRAQSFWANHGHLAYIRADGTVWITLEEESHHTDLEIGRIDGFDPSTEFDVEVSIDETLWRVQFGPVAWERKLSELPQVFGTGRVILQSYFAWLGLSSLSVEGHGRHRVPVQGAFCVPRPGLPPCCEQKNPSGCRKSRRTITPPNTLPLCQTPDPLEREQSREGDQVTASGDRLVAHIGRSSQRHHAQQYFCDVGRKFEARRLRCRHP